MPIFRLRPMLAVSSPPFDSPNFLYEVKWDGYRCLAYIDGKTILQSRNLRDLTPSFPELSNLHYAVKGQPVVLDGEIIVLDDKGRPSFNLLKARGNLTDEWKVRQAAGRNPALFVAFDLLYYQGENIMLKPLEVRRGWLQEALPHLDNLVVSTFIDTYGTRFFESCLKQGLEGVMAKERRSPYLPGRRSSYWRKFRRTQQGQFLILGYQPGTGRRSLGALLLGEYQDGRLVYRGKVGTGFDQEEEQRLLMELEKLPSISPPFAEPVPGLTRPRWVEPRLVCEVEYLEETPEGHLRHPSYRGLLLRLDHNGGVSPWRDERFPLSGRRDFT
ncbi:non-homologous end-joining DNA ligase [Thermanaeromonas toyohensis]|uniref:non-homologous end-joining DNA ligase n=1 Tax=Thermanaeromonas toyohensis TaxID=161154 RepID=UPI001E4923B4|nr:non-homologous end-joining DNA ligase [Thermanaeromonas toyohensis]